MKTREERHARYVQAEIKRKAKYAEGMAAINAKESANKDKWAAAKAARVEAAKPAPMTEEQKAVHDRLALGMSSSSLADTMRSPIWFLLLPATISMMRKERKLAKWRRESGE